MNHSKCSKTFGRHCTIVKQVSKVSTLTALVFTVMWAIFPVGWWFKMKRNTSQKYLRFVFFSNDVNDTPFPLTVVDMFAIDTVGW